jgi:CDP-diacylglycerol--glycerol-3-phosphate 3-phosphatidyltransferase
MKREEFFATWSTLHLDAEIKGIVKGWLSISYVIARGLSALRITPNVLTLLGVLSGVALLFYPVSILGLIFLVLSLICDGVDGSVAIVSGKVSKFGATLDAIADRITEALWFFALYQWGIAPEICLALFALALTQEYARARMASLGFEQIGVVTIAERPVRASAIAIFMVLDLLSFSFAAIALYIFTAMALVSVYQVMKAARGYLVQ